MMGISTPHPADMIDISRARAFLRRKSEARAKALDERFQRACSDFQRMVEWIAARHNPARIWQWGSLLDRSRFTEISDIDIAVEGLDSCQAFSDLLGELLGMTDFPLDLVEMERIGAENASHIRRHGRLVYERC